MKNFGEESFVVSPEYPLLSQERVRLQNSNFAGIFRVSMRRKAVKNLGERRAWAYPGTSQIFRVPPIISRTGKATNFKQIWHVYSQSPREQKPIKNLGQK